jgi:membrane-bound lytic murein transglycosylase A
VREGASPSSLQQAIAQSVEYLQKLPPPRSFPALDRHVTVSELLDVANGFAAILSRGGDLPHDVCERFRLYRAELPDRLLITGYYEPELAASRVPTERFRYPLYRTPEDLVDLDLGEFAPGCRTGIVQGRVQDGKLIPYYSRAEIDAGALADRDYEIAWLDDPVEAFFVHVQGSARLRFPDGVYMDVSYSSSNGRPYTSIGRVLIEQGKMAVETVSLSSLKDYLRSHPEEQPGLLATNQRYIFFRVVATGPIGSLEVPLTAGRSVAADARAYPPAAAVFLRVAPPATSTPSATPETYSRFAVIQDAGAAITGPNRIDVFWGSGSTAESIAGDMHSPGELYLVLPR